MPAMKTPAFLLLTIMISIQSLARTSSPSSNTPCRIVDVVKTVAGHDYYVDGKRAGADTEVNVLELLRRREASSPSSCLRAFVPTSIKINEIQNFLIVANKMQYKEFHTYVYDEHHDSVAEILWEGRMSDGLRWGINGTVRWPDVDSGGK